MIGCNSMTDGEVVPSTSKSIENLKNTKNDKKKNRKREEGGKVMLTDDPV